MYFENDLKYLKQFILPHLVLFISLFMHSVWGVRILRYVTNACNAAKFTYPEPIHVQKQALGCESGCEIDCEMS